MTERNGTRAPRFLVPNGEKVLIALGSRRLQGMLRVLSLNGGRMRLPESVAPGSFAEIRVSTVAGPFTAAIELLEIDGANTQAFRFVQIGPTDQRRLEGALKKMGGYGFGTSRLGIMSLLLRAVGRAGSWK